MNLRASLMLAGLILAGLRGRCQVSGVSAGQFDLGTLQQAAIDTDPRSRAAAAVHAADRSPAPQHRVRSGCRPSTIDGQAQYQSDVAHRRRRCRVCSALFLPPKDTFDSGIRLDQRLFDTTIGVQSALERAQLAENQARVRTTLFALRQQVNDAFFAAAALQARAGALAATIDGSERTTAGNERARSAGDGARRRMRRRSKPHCCSGSRTTTTCRRTGAARSTRLATLTGQTVGGHRHARAARSGRRRRAGAAVAVDAARPPRVRAVRAHARTTRPTAGTDRGAGASAAVDLRTRRRTESRD